MSYDEVYVDPAVAGSGVRSWQAAADALQAQLSATIAAIHAAHGAAPWGGDGAGGQFADAYLPSADNVASSLQPSVQQIGELGDGAELAIQKSLDSDAVQATAVTIDVESGL